MSDYSEYRKQEKAKVGIYDMIIALTVVALVVVVGVAVVEADDSIESRSAIADHSQKVSHNLQSDQQGTDLQRDNLSDLLAEVAAVANKYSGGLPTKVKNLIHHSLSQGVHHLAEAGSFVLADMPVYSPPRVLPNRSHSKDNVEKAESAENSFGVPSGGVVAGVQSNGTSSEADNQTVSLLAQSMTELTNVVARIASNQRDRSVVYNESNPDTSTVTKSFLRKRLEDLRNLMYQNDESVMDSSDDYDHPDDIALGELTVSNDTISDFTGSNLSVSDGVLNASGGGGSASAASSSGAVQFSGGSGNLQADADNFFWDDNNKRLGIGTSSPSTVLDVAGDITTDGILDINGTGTSTIESDIDIAGSILPRSDSVYNLGAPNLQWKDVYISSGSLYIDGQRVLGEDDGGSVSISADDDQDINIKTSGTGGIQLNPSGSGSANIINGNFGVGIGTSTPVTTLEVGGTTTADAISVGGDTITDFTGSNLSVSSGSLTADPNDTVDGGELDNLFSQNGFLERTGANTYRATSTIDISDDTNLTASAGASLTGDDISVDAVDTLSTNLTSGSLVFSDGSTLAQDNTNLFWDNTNNRLGVGTTTPTAILDVVGNARFTGILDIEGTGTSTVEDSLHVKDDIAVGTNSTILSGSSLSFGGAGTVSVNNGLDISATDVALGRVSSGVPQNVTISGMDATQDNTDGGDMIFEASSGLGESTSGSFVFKTGNNLPEDIAFDNSSTGDNYGTQVSFNHTVGTDRADRILIAGVSIEETGDVTSVTYGGQNLTKLVEVNAGTGYKEIGTDLWYLLDPPTGSNTVSISTDLGSSEYIVAGAASYYGVNQSNPFDTPVTGKDWGGSTPPSIDVGSDDGDLVIDVLGIDYGDSPGSGQTQRWVSDYSLENYHSTEPGGGTTTMSWSGNGEWSQVGVAMNPVEIPSDQPMTLVDALRISPSGDVGIGGVGNPNYSLHAAGGAAAQRVLATLNGTESDPSFGWEGTDSGMFYNDTNLNRSIDFVLNGTTEASLDSYSLSVGSGSLNETGVSTTDGKIGSISNYDNTPNTAFGANSSAPFAIDTDRYNNNNAEGWDLFITQTGNVSIGTTSPSSLLDVAGTTTSQTLVASSTETDTLAANNFSIGGDTITDFTGGGLSLSSQILGVDNVETLSTNLTSGSLVFSDGSTLAEDNANLFWDDTNSRLGIGTTTPTSPLQVAASSTNSAVRISNNSVGSPLLQAFNSNNEEVLQVDQDQYGGDGILRMYNTDGTQALQFTTDPYTQSYLDLGNGTFGFYDSDPDANLEVSASGSTGGNIFLLSSNNGADGDIFTATQDGNIGIGTTSPTSTLHVAGTIRQSNATNCELATDANGDLICSGTSDERLKTDINNLDASSALSKLDELEGKTFRFRPEADLGGDEEVGFIAQDVEKVFPNLVGENNGRKYIRYDKLTPLLTEAMQEVNQKVENINRTGLASFWTESTSTASTSDSSQKPINSFIAAVGATLEEFVSDIKARFKEVFADKVVAEKELCVGETCVDESELQALLEQQADNTNSTDGSTDTTDGDGDMNVMDPKDEESDDSSTEESTASSTDETSTTTEDSTGGDGDSTDSDETSTTTESTDDSTDETSTSSTSSSQATIDDTTTETTEEDTGTTTDSTATDYESSTTDGEESDSTVSSTDSTDETSTTTSSE